MSVGEREKVTTAGAVHAMLREKFAAPAWAYLAEVPDGTGMNKRRTADALAMSLWASRGLELVGVEIKVSRSDWARELADPAKAESVCRYCDRWYVAVGDRAIVKDGELPPTWGLLAPKGGKMAVVREAPKLDPAPVDRAFLAAILRRVADTETNAGLLKEVEQRCEWKVREARKQGEEAGRQAAINSGDRMLKQATDELRGLKESIAKFEAASGIRFTPWQAGRIGEAVEFVTNGRLDGQKYLVDRLRTMGADMLKVVGEYEAAVASLAAGGEEPKEATR